MSGDERVIEQVRELLEGTDIAVGRFFGGWSLRRRGVQVGIVMDTVYVKVAPADRSTWEASGSYPFRWGVPERVVEAYWAIPDALSDTDALYAQLTSSGLPDAHCS